MVCSILQDENITLMFNKLISHRPLFRFDYDVPAAPSCSRFGPNDCQTRLLASFLKRKRLFDDFAAEGWIDAAAAVNFCGET